MFLIGYLISAFYLWFGYKIFTGKTFGSFIYQIITIITWFSLYLSSVLFIFKSNIYYLLIPTVPYIIYSLYEDRIRRKMKNIIYKKN